MPVVVQGRYRGWCTVQLPSALDLCPPGSRLSVRAVSISPWQHHQMAATRMQSLHAVMHSTPRHAGGPFAHGCPLAVILTAM